MAQPAAQPFCLDRPTFVTRASGLVGPRLTRALIGQKADVVCLIRDRVRGSLFFQAGLDRQATIVPGDLASQEVLERILGEYEIDTVIHLAAQTLVPVANRNPV